MHGSEREDTWWCGECDSKGGTDTTKLDDTDIGAGLGVILTTTAGHRPPAFGELRGRSVGLRGLARGIQR